MSQNPAKLILMTRRERREAMKPREMSRAERLHEIRRWIALVDQKTKGERVGLDPDSYRRYAESKFLLEEIDLLLVEEGTRETRALSVVVKPVDPADFVETITLKPGAFNTTLPAAPVVPLPTDPPPMTAPISATEQELINQTVQRCQMAAERALVEASRLRLDMHGIKGAVERAIRECRRPTPAVNGWDDAHSR